MYKYILFTFLYTLGISHAQTIVINEVQASNQSTIQDDDGDYSDWIELYNADTVWINLQGYGLSDDYSRPFRWVFPSVVIAPNNYLIVWASGKNRVGAAGHLHTNFSISAVGEEVILTRPDSVRLDESPPTAIATDLSFGRFPNGGGPRVLFAQPTPGTANTTPPFVEIPAPVFSHTSGFYQHTFGLQLSHPDTNAIIVYTIDGSEPMLSRLSGAAYAYKNQYPHFPGQTTGPMLHDTMWSYVFIDSISIYDRSADSNTISAISSTFEFNQRLPPTPVKKATVIKARAYVQGDSSRVVTHTFFVDRQPIGSLPIISLATDASNLFDYQEGIYVAGSDFDDWRSNNPTVQPHATRSGANFHRRGIAAEKPASFEYFVQQNRVINQNLGVRIHGNTSRTTSMKSLRLYPRSVYDNKNTLDYPFFGSDARSSFNRLMLRNSGQDFHRTHFRDAFLQASVAHLPFTTQRYQPAEVYINGEFFGVSNIRTRYDKHFMEAEYGIAEADLDLLENGGEVVEGSNAHFLQMRTFIRDNNMALAVNYDSVHRMMDVENFTDYHIANIFFSNRDWPGNNIIFFRKKTSQYDSLAPYGQDGRWRWMLFDTDFSFGLGGTPPANMLAQATEAGNTAWPNPDWSTVILRNLLENTHYRAYFINRFADLMNTTFDANRMIAIVDSFAARIDPYVDDMHHRWSGIGPATTYDRRVRRLRSFANRRIADQQRHIMTELNVDTTVVVTVDVSDPAKGYVKWSTLDLLSSTVGINDTVYPWFGTYFYNVPIKARAIPYPGYQFSHWSGSDTSRSPHIVLTPLGNIQLTAHFEPVDTQDVIHYWAMTNGLPNNTPLENVQATHHLTAAAGSIIFQSAYAGYPFTPADSLWRNSSMERRNQPTTLHYLPYANQNIPYASANIRGLQVRQRLKHQSDSVAMTLRFATRYFKDIRIDMAVVDEGAAEALFVDYFDDDKQVYSTENLSDSIFPITTDNYFLVGIDLSNVQKAIHRDSIDVRLRFISQNPEANDGNRVTFNNIGVKGTPIDFPCDTGYYQDIGCGVAFDRHGNPHFTSTTLIDTQFVAGRCDSIYVQDIIVYPNVQHNILAAASTACYGDSILLYADTTALANSALDSIVWLRDSTVIERGLYAYATETGVYRSIYHHSNGCSDTSSIQSIIIFPRPVLHIDSTVTVCADELFIPLQHPASFAGSYRGMGVENDTFFPGRVGVGVYDILFAFTDTNGCSDSIYLTYIVDSLPAIQALTPTFVCTGDTVVLQTSLLSNTTYTWYRNNQALPNDTAHILKVTQSGFYRVKNNDTTRCNNSSLEVEVTVFPTDTAGFVDRDIPNLCQGDSFLVQASPGHHGIFQWYRDGQPIPGGIASVFVVVAPGHYHYERVDSNGCLVKSDSLFVDSLQTVYPNERLCYVTTDTASGAVVSLWTQTANRGTSFFTVSARDRLGVERSVVTPFSSVNYWVDTLAALSNDVYTYKLSWQDTCGGVLEYKNTYRNIRLTGSELLQDINLRWNTYSDSSDVAYTIYQSHEDSLFQAIGSTFDTVYKVILPPLGKKKYFVGVALSEPCSPSGSMTDSLYQNISEVHSNIFTIGHDLRVSLHRESPVVNIYPNPTTASSTVVTDIVPQDIQVFDALGNLIQHIHQPPTNETIISFSRYSAGIYFVHIHWTNSHIVRKVVYMQRGLER